MSVRWVAHVDLSDPKSDSADRRALMELEELPDGARAIVHVGRRSDLSYDVLHLLPRLTSRIDLQIEGHVHALGAWHRLLGGADLPLRPPAEAVGEAYSKGREDTEYVERRDAHRDRWQPFLAMPQVQRPGGDAA